MGNTRRDLLTAFALLGAFVPIMLVNCLWFSQPEMTVTQAFAEFWPFELMAFASLAAYARLSR